jgi:cytochrome c biogenesis protein CcmG/thiol:disulfide interchange protein DsbE
MKKIFLFLPILIILIISIFLLIYLLQKKDPNKPPSALLNENLPKFTMVNLLNKTEIFNKKNIEERYVLINFFASWCAPCKVEHPLFFEIKKQNPNLYLIGINHKDKKNDSIKYLNAEGNPYDFIGIDRDGLIALEFGVFGLPETFLVNSSGIIINKFLGPLTKKIIKDEIKPFIK